MTKPTLPRIAILGAGPIGLEAAIYARTLGHPTTVYDSGQVAEHVLRWGHIKMFTAFGSNVTTLGKNVLLREEPTLEFPPDGEVQTGRDYRDTYLVPLTETALLKSSLQLQTLVLTIGRTGWRKTDPLDAKKPLPPFRLLVRDAKGVERFDVADIVLDCTGTYSKPNWVGDGGIPAAGEILARPQVSYWLDEILGNKKAHYAGKSIVLIGGGYSGATTMCQLAELAEENQSTWVIWLSHGPRGGPLPRIPNDPLRERDKLAVRGNSLASRCDSNLEYHAQMCIDELISHGPDKGFRVAGHIGTKPMSWEVDRVIANVGYRPDMTLCQELRIAEPNGDIITSEPGYYFLGAKSKGRDSNFLLREGHEQVRRAFAAISGNRTLDLHARKAA